MIDLADRTTSRHDAVPAIGGSARPWRSGRRSRLGTAVGASVLAMVIAACGVEDADDAETLPGIDAEVAGAEVAPGTPSNPSFTRHRALVDEYEAFDVTAAVEADGCRHTISKQLTGRWVAQHEQIQSGGYSATKTLKHAGRLQIFVEPGSSDSALSREVLEGEIEGEFVAAYEGEDATGRGTLHGRWAWDDEAVGTYFAVLDVGSHDDTPPATELSDTTARAEGVMFGAVTHYSAAGGLIEGAITFDFSTSGAETQFTGVVEGVLITECP